MTEAGASCKTAEGLFLQGRGGRANPAHAADRLIEYPIVAGLVYVSYQLLSGMLFHPAAADAPSVDPV